MTTITMVLLRHLTTSIPNRPHPIQNLRHLLHAEMLSDTKSANRLGT